MLTWSLWYSSVFVNVVQTIYVAQILVMLCITHTNTHHPTGTNVGHQYHTTDKHHLESIRDSISCFVKRKKYKPTRYILKSL